ncbi:MAG: alcohol dehydrogenase catalytic domain-containing protein [Peptococcaceae bacterium]|nr:alcohol dehydrogenase catalytic domain-containing protein [Peptococcaceae bacterium]
MTANKGLVIESPGKLKLINIPLRELEDDEVLVRVRYVALCGSDIKLYLGSYSAPHKYPLVIGHEWVGEIEQVGSGVGASWHIGNVVTGDCSIFCNSCSYCTTNKNHCANIEKKGITQDGACCRYIIAKDQHIYNCPKLPDIKPLALAEPLAVAVQGIINRIPEECLKRVRSALIIGCGGIGVMALFSLLEFQIPKITIVDSVKEKLSIVSSLGYSNVNTIETDLSDYNTNLVEGFDLIVEAAGSCSALRRAFELANPCGKIICLGHQKNTELDFGMVIKKSLSIFGSIGSTGGFEKAIQIIKKNHSNISKMITKIVPIDKAGHFFKNELQSSKNIKVLIDLN